MSILGALFGDAAGAILEFYRKGTITREVAYNAMHMPGGGVHIVGSGQITDDGELTLTLYRALQRNKNIRTLGYELACAYAHWYDSMPFDIGNTCSDAFCAAKEHIKGNIASFAQLLHVIAQNNSASEANGALMRASAIPAYIYKARGTLEQALHISRLDSQLSHPNMVCQEINAIYVHAAYLLLHKRYDISETYNYILHIYDTDTQRQLLDWYKMSDDVSGLDCKHNAGHIKHAFILCMYFLKNRHISYETAILMTLMKGGDTDTNAAIVGGLVGIYSDIPKYMKNPVLSFDCTKEGNIRPSEFSVKNIA